jgi:hypothetical protein
VAGTCGCHGEELRLRWQGRAVVVEGVAVEVLGWAQDEGPD